jgi:hypothetical protein
MIYYIKRKLYQIKNLFLWIPIIWKQYDFDYNYAINVFKFQLLKMADLMDSDKSHCVGAKERAKRIRMVVRLMDKVYNEEYNMEYRNKVEEIYGKDILDLSFEDTFDGTGSKFLKYKYELTETPEKQIEIRETVSKLMKESHNKQSRAHKLLWELVEHNIQDWWD